MDLERRKNGKGETEYEDRKLDENKEQEKNVQWEKLLTENFRFSRSVYRKPNACNWKRKGKKITTPMK